MNINPETKLLGNSDKELINSICECALNVLHGSIPLHKRTRKKWQMILKALNQHQQTGPPAVQKAVTLNDEMGEVLNRKTVNDHDKPKKNTW